MSTLFVANFFMVCLMLMTGLGVVFAFVAATVGFCLIIKDIKKGKL